MVPPPLLRAGLRLCAAHCYFYYPREYSWTMQNRKLVHRSSPPPLGGGGGPRSGGRGKVLSKTYCKPSTAHVLNAEKKESWCTRVRISFPRRKHSADFCFSLVLSFHPKRKDINPRSRSPSCFSKRKPPLRSGEADGMLLSFDRLNPFSASRRRGGLFSRICPPRRSPRRWRWCRR